MGRLLLIARLALGDIRRRRLQSALLVVMIVTTTSTLTLGLALHRVSQSPFEHTRAVTRGPDVVAQVGSGPDSTRPSVAQLAPLRHAPGVAATAGPYPVARARLTAPGASVAIEAVGRDAAPATIDRPLVVAGEWVHAGGVVLEKGLADSFGLHVGETVRLAGRRFEVAGVAVTAAYPFYPACLPALVWTTRADAASLAGRQPLGYVLDIDLTQRSATDAFLASPAAGAFQDATSNEPSALQAWQWIRTDDYRLIALNQKAMLVGSWLLSLLAIASIAVVVGGRMAEQTRRVGLLKAVGGTPTLVAVVLLAENLLLAVAAAIVGLIAGDLLAPLLANPGAGLLGSAQSPRPSLSGTALVVGVAVAVALAATLVPAIRGARTSTIRALNDAAHPPRRRPLLIALSARLPLPLLLGLRLVARRTRRTILTCASLTIAVAMVVAVLAVQHRIQLTDREQWALFAGAAVGARATHVMLLLSSVLVALAAISATFTAWATVIDARGSTALMRALGATPRQISAGFTAAQLLPGALAALAGIPAGLLLYELAGGHLGNATPPVLWLVAVIPGTLIAVAVVTAIPARIGARRSVAEVLRAE